MRHDKKLWLAIACSAAIGIAGCGDSCEPGISVRGLSQEKAKVLEALMPWTAESTTCQVSGYALMAPTNGGPQGAVMAPDGTTVIFTGPRSVALTKRDEVLVSLDDLTGSGRFDTISYSIVDPTDGQRYSVTDADADGRLDTKIGDNAGFVNIDGNWCRLEKREGQLGAHVDGTWKQLERRGRVWHLKLQ